MSTTETFVMYEHGFDKFCDTMKSLNRKANKLGLPLMNWTITKQENQLTRIWDKTDTYHVDVMKKVITVEVSGYLPKIAGWFLVAQLLPGENGNIIKSISQDIPLPEIYRTAKSCCDHCKTIRPRNQTYIIYNPENHEYKQIGSSCLKDYLQNQDAVAIAEYYSNFHPTLSEEPEDDFENIRHGRFTFSLVEYLSWVKRAIVKNGWKSASDTTPGLPTKQIAMETMLDQRGELPISDTEREEIKNILKTVESFLGKKYNLSDYENNLYLIAREEYIDYRLIGYAASILPFYDKLQERIQSEKVKASQNTSNYLGTIGGKLENLKVTLLSCRELNGIYGITYLYNFLDDIGNKITWFASSCQDIEIGQSAKIAKCTVKDHKIYNGENQTVITRAKLA